MLSGRAAFSPSLDGVAEGPFSCTLEARFFAEDPNASSVLIFRPGLRSGDPLFPRDVLAEFPFARKAGRAVWHEIVPLGETWTHHECEDIFATSGDVGLDFDNLTSVYRDRAVTDVETVSEGHTVGTLTGVWTVVIPDITFPAPGIIWKVPPPNPEDWTIRWTLFPAQD